MLLQFINDLNICIGGDSVGALEVTIILVSVVFIIGGLVASNILSKNQKQAKSMIIKER